MARPSILTDVLIAKFCAKLRISGSIETAIKSTGIGRESYYGWARKVRDGEGSKMQKSFIRAVEEAEGETKFLREHLLSKHFAKNWQALAWWLERKYSNEYGQRRPLPLPEADTGQERVVDRVVWRTNDKAAPAVAAPAVAEPTVPVPSPLEEEEENEESVESEPVYSDPFEDD